MGVHPMPAGANSRLKKGGYGKYSYLLSLAFCCEVLYNALKIRKGRISLTFSFFNKPQDHPVGAWSARRHESDSVSGVNLAVQSSRRSIDKNNFDLIKWDIQLFY